MFNYDIFWRTSQTDIPDAVFNLQFVSKLFTVSRGKHTAESSTCILGFVPTFKCPKRTASSVAIMNNNSYLFLLNPKGAWGTDQV